MLQCFLVPVLVDGSCPVNQPSLCKIQPLSTQDIAGLEVNAAAHQELDSAMY